MKAQAKISVMVVDDHPVVRFGIAAIIKSQSQMTVVAEAATGEEAINKFRIHKPDVVLMDLRMPGRSGVEAIHRIRAEFARSRFVVLTTYKGDEDIHRAIAAGAQGYLLKGMSHDDLLSAIRTVHAGLKYLPESVRDSLARRPPNSDLRARELEVLELIVHGRSNKEIAEALGITEGTVKWHVNIILGRLQVSDRTQAAVAALSRGIIPVSNT